MSHLKTVSSQHIVSKIARTFKPSDSTWIVDCLEDIGWAIQAIGYHAGFEKKATEYPYITVNHHRGKIPCDVERILHVERLRVYNETQNILNPDGTTPDVSEVEESCPPVYKGVMMKLASDTSAISVSENTPRTTDMDISNVPDVYQINGDYVVTGFEQGLIKLHYVGFVIDKGGAPCVIDDFSYKSCCEFYCISQMIFRGYRNPEISYDKAFQHFEKYRLEAENACKMMSLDKARSFDASWNRYVRSIDFGSNFYAGLEQQEYISR